MSMFGKRSVAEAAPGKPAAPAREVQSTAPAPQPQTAPVASAPVPQLAPQPSKPVARPVADTRSEDYYQIKSTIFNALIDTIDLAQLAQSH